MATRDEILKRAREIITSEPSAGKNKINQILKIEYGVGLRSSKILEVKAEVSRDNPKLAPELYRTGGVRPSYRAIYREYIKNGFIPYEARELALGGGRLSPEGSLKVLGSQPGQAALKSRRDWVVARLKDGFTKKEIRQMIINDYNKWLGTRDKHGKPFSPWSAIRDEYRPKPRISKQAYKDMLEKRKIKKEARQNKRRAKEH